MGGILIREKLTKLFWRWREFAAWRLMKWSRGVGGQAAFDRNAETFRAIPGTSQRMLAEQRVRKLLDAVGRQQERIPTERQRMQRTLRRLIKKV